MASPVICARSAGRVVVARRAARARLPPPKHRTFLNDILNPSSSSRPETFKASRTVPCSASELYRVISDIDSYHSFIPYCSRSEVTSWSSSSPRSPQNATLQISWTNLSESFSSRIHCVPDQSVEALSGDTQSRESTSADQSSLFTHLLTRWTLNPKPYKPPSPQKEVPVSEVWPPQSDLGGPTANGPSSQTDNTVGTTQTSSKGTVTRSVGEVQHYTDVSIYVEYSFRNPMYNSISKLAAPKAGEKIIEAFEKRVEALRAQTSTLIYDVSRDLSQRTP